jgi:hypothetical protein
LEYRFNIARITKSVKAFLEVRDLSNEKQEFLKYVVECLIYEYELPLNIHKPKASKHIYEQMKSSLILEYFHEFACIYSNMYTCLTEVLDKSSYNKVITMEFGENILFLNVKEDDDY